MCPAGRMLPRHQAQPGREVPCALKQADVGDFGHNQGCGDRTNAVDRRKAACAVVVPGIGHDFRFECLGTLRQHLTTVKQPSDCLPCPYRDDFVGLHEHYKLPRLVGAQGNREAGLGCQVSHALASIVRYLTSWESRLKHD